MADLQVYENAVRAVQKKKAPVTDADRKAVKAFCEVIADGDSRWQFFRNSLMQASILGKKKMASRAYNQMPSIHKALDDFAEGKNFGANMLPLVTYYVRFWRDFAASESEWYDTFCAIQEELSKNPKIKEGIRRMLGGA